MTEDARSVAAPWSAVRATRDQRELVEIGWLALPTVAPVAVGLLAPTSGPFLLVALGVAVGLAALSFFRLRTRPVQLFTSILVWLTIERLALAAVSPRLSHDALYGLLAY